MRTQAEIESNPALQVYDAGPDGGRGWINLGRGHAGAATVVWSSGGGWDHVSVSYSTRCPTWDEMCKVKDAFFRPDECCVQYHPAESDYINHHKYCLHIWRPQGVNIQTPPLAYV